MNLYSPVTVIWNGKDIYEWMFGRCCLGGSQVRVLGVAEG